MSRAKRKRERARTAAWRKTTPIVWEAVVYGVSVPMPRRGRPTPTPSSRQLHRRAMRARKRRRGW